MDNIKPNQCMTDKLDYAFQWWANGFAYRFNYFNRPGRREDNPAPKVLCFQTGRFGLALDVEKVRLLRLGLIPEADPADQVVCQEDKIISLPPGQLALEVEAGGQKYVCSAGAIRQDDPLTFPVRMVEHGRLFHRTDVQQLVFVDSLGSILPADCRLEMAVWPDRLTLILEVTPKATLDSCRLTLKVAGDGAGLSGQCVTEPIPAQPGQKLSAAVTLWPGAENPAAERADDGVSVTARDLIAPGGPIAATRDSLYGWHHIELPQIPDVEAFARIGLSLVNDSDSPRTLRLAFWKDGNPGLTGCTPMIRDSEGNPTGLMVQLSKNWHLQKDRRMLYDGVWFRGLSIVHLPPRSKLDCEFTMAYARWGGLPAASHSQLCLIGWGHNQLWDQAAIGSWGENICYEPDATQRRCMIDDIRPLMVTPMSDDPAQRWNWTNNVGGGDFLVYFDAAGRHRPLKRVRTYYRDHGPNLTCVTYAGLTDDEAIATRMDVLLPRCDDMTRACHRFRYDVRRATRFSRLAFYQLGSDHYLWFGYEKIARGNESGLIDEWQPRKAEWEYENKGIECSGAVPWFSLHESVRPAKALGAWANRGLVIRSWKARLGGRDVPAPFASIFGTFDSYVPSAALELSPPPDVTELLPGDYVDCEVEVVIIPQASDDYYGPNENLRAALAEGANTWKPVFREAVGNDLQVRASAGKVLHNYPVVVDVDEKQSAAIDIAGGVGYVPITFVGLTDYRGYQLSQTLDGKTSKVDQAVLGNDFWQAGYDAASKRWGITYNVNLDSPRDKRRNVQLIFRPMA
ncbi:MAG: hypothetical protein WC869_08935 [Phycisphaerae bacterium]